MSDSIQSIINKIDALDTLIKKSDEKSRKTQGGNQKVWKYKLDSQRQEVKALRQQLRDAEADAQRGNGWIWIVCLIVSVGSWVYIVCPNPFSNKTQPEAQPTRLVQPRQ